MFYTHLLHPAEIILASNLSPKTKKFSLADNILAAEANTASQMKSFKRATSNTDILHNIPTKRKQNLAVIGHGN